MHVLYLLYVIECLLFYSTMPAKMLVWYSGFLNALSKKKCTHVHNTIWMVLGASLFFLNHLLLILEMARGTYNEQSGNSTTLSSI